MSIEWGTYFKLDLADPQEYCHSLDYINPPNTCLPLYPRNESIVEVDLIVVNYGLVLVKQEFRILDF